MRFKVHKVVASAAPEGASQFRWLLRTTLLVPPPAASAAAATGDAWCGADAGTCAAQKEYSGPKKQDRV